MKRETIKKRILSTLRTKAPATPQQAAVAKRQRTVTLYG